MNRSDSFRIPAPYLEELGSDFFVDTAFEPAPGNQNAYVRFNVGHHSDQLVQRWTINLGIRSLDLDTNPGMTQTQGCGSGQ